MTASAHLPAGPVAIRSQADAYAPPARPAPQSGGTLEAWLCALIAALLGRLEPIAHLLPSNASYPTADAESLCAVRATIRAANRLRAWIGWVLRLIPHRGMPRTFARLAPAAPLTAARAPPRSA